METIKRGLGLKICGQETLSGIEPEDYRVKLSPGTCGVAHTFTPSIGSGNCMGHIWDHTSSYDCWDDAYRD